MSPTYYQIELSARWLTVLLVGLAVLLVLAFVFGYGAAWSVLSARQGSSPAEAVPPVAVVTPPPGNVVALSEVTPTPARPSLPVVAEPTATATAAATATATATATPMPRPTVAPTATPARSEATNEAPFWVQVVAASSRGAIAKACKKVERLGFPASHQRLVEAAVAGGGVLVKLRVGPFPDRASADRVALRMREQGFSDAWVVVP